MAGPTLPVEQRVSLPGSAQSVQSWGYSGDERTGSGLAGRAAGDHRRHADERGQASACSQQTPAQADAAPRLETVSQQARRRLASAAIAACAFAEGGGDG